MYSVPAPGDDGDRIRVRDCYIGLGEEAGLRERFPRCHESHLDAFLIANFTMTLQMITDRRILDCPRIARWPNCRVQCE